MPIWQDPDLFSRDQRRRKRLPTLAATRSEEHTSELQSRQYLVCRLLLEKKKLYSRSALCRLTASRRLLDTPLLPHYCLTIGTSFSLLRCSLPPLTTNVHTSVTTTYSKQH